ncbi:carph-isopro domain-containing protein [Brevundimonas diminuta]|uniref:carph-isopro domain-containing protein n=1 Tax=Brevundimonas diminuta TaxID=293 RepID=UPI003F80C27C
MQSVFQKFGGIRPMATKLGDTPVSTVKSWHVKGHIPSWRHDAVLDAAKRHSISLSREELLKITPDEADADVASVARREAA